MPASLERLPRRLQQQPLLRIHRQRLARRRSRRTRRRTPPRRRESRPRARRSYRVVGIGVDTDLSRSQPRSVGNCRIASRPSAPAPTGPPASARRPGSGSSSPRSRSARPFLSHALVRSPCPGALETLEQVARPARPGTDSRTRGSPAGATRSPRPGGCATQRRQRVKAKLLERPTRLHGPRRDMPEHARDL